MCACVCNFGVEKVQRPLIAVVVTIYNGSRMSILIGRLDDTRLQKTMISYQQVYLKIDLLTWK